MDERTVFKHYDYNTPNNAVPNGPVCGNGDIGVSLDASREWARLWIGKNDFWCYRPVSLGGGMKSAGFVMLGIENMERASFETWQNISDAHIGADFEKDGNALHMTAFSPRGENLVLIDLECAKGEAVYSMKMDTLSCDPLSDIARAYKKDSILITKSYIRNRPEYPCAAALVLRAYEGALAGTLRAGEKARFVLSVFTNADTEGFEKAASDTAGAMNAERADALRKKNNAWWKNFYAASSVSLPDEPEIEKSYVLSNYILACCSDRSKFAPGIFGNFLTSDKPNWGGDYHLNYNHQAPFWGLYSCNHIPEADAYHRPVLEYMEKARKNALERLGCRGLYAKVGIGPKGYESSAMFNREDASPNERAPYWDQKSNSLYSGINFIMRYYFTLDEEYLKEIAYPYLKEVGLFWLDYLVYENGRYTDKNDCIHENSAAAKGVYNKDREHTDYQSDTNPIVTLGLLWTTFASLIDMSETLNTDADLRILWKQRLEKLSDYTTHTVNGREVFRYTEKGMAWNDSNSLGIQHIYPAGAVTLDSDERLLKLSRDTLEVMARWEDYNAFPTFFTAAVRIGYDPDIILSRMRGQILMHSYKNGFIYYGGGGIECMSAVPSTINDMLVQNYAGKLRVFPVWNMEKDAAFQNLRTYGALLVSASVKGGQVQPVTVISEKETDVCFVSPWPEGARATENGQVISEGAKVFFRARANGRYRIEKA